MQNFAILLAGVGKLLKFGSGVIGMICALNVEGSFMFGLGIFIVVTLVVTVIGFIMQLAGNVLMGGNER